jgi:hypothetical protein
VNYAAVVSALVLAYSSFFFQYNQLKTRKAVRDFKRDGEANNSPSHDQNVIARVSHQ